MTETRRLLILLSLVVSFIVSAKFKDVFPSYEEDPKISKIEPTELTVVAVGDLMLGTDYPSREYLPPDDGKSLLAQARDVLKSGDIVFGNLEGCLADGVPPVKKCRTPQVCFLFRMPERYVFHLKGAGFNLLSLANNHIMDFGEEGAKRTLKVLEKEGIYHAGLLIKPVENFEVKGFKVGFAAFGTSRGVLDLRNLKVAMKMVAELASQNHIVIVSFHGGGEGKDYRHVTRQKEIFLGEDRGNVYEFAHAMVDAGADLVIGHGPHVPRALELYQGRLIIYSLGNFCTYGMFNLKEPNNLAPVLKIKLNSEGKFLGGKIYSFIQEGKGGPVPDVENRAAKEIKTLTEQDFPETPLFITEEGEVRLNPS